MHTAATSERRLLDDLRALSRPFWILCAGTFINRLGTFVWPFLTIYLTRQGYTPYAASWAVGCMGAGSLLGGAVGGWLTDHFGRRYIIAAGATTSAALTLVLYNAHGLPAILLCTFAMGFIGATHYPAASALMADVVPEPLRVCSSAVFRLSLNAGFAFGVALGGVLANHSIRWLFFGDAITTFLYAMVALCFLPHGLRGQTREAPWGMAWLYMAQDRAFHALLLSSLGVALLYSQFGTTFSLQITRLHLTLPVLGHLIPPETVYGLLLGWNGAMVTLFELSLTRWTQTFAPRRAMAAGFLLLGLGFGLNAFAGTVLAYFLTMTLFTLGEMISSPVAQAYVSNLAPAALRGRYMGVSDLPHSLGVIAGPVLGSLIFQHNPAMLWAACAVLGLLSALTILRMGRTEE
jgi:MFS family permease